MKGPEPIYTMEDLVSITGVPKRTIRLWIQRGRVPKSPVKGGIGPHYTEGHVKAILRMVRVKEQQVTLADLSERFGFQERQTV